MSTVAEAMAKTRRQQQDYTCFDNFLTAAGWTHLSRSGTQRDMCAALSQLLYERLDLRLPSEPYASMVSFVS